MRPTTALLLLGLLAGCTDREWSGTMSFIGLEKTPPPARAVARPVQPVARAAPAPIQSVQAAQPNAFCESVAKQDSESNGFDAATQNRVFVRSYQQCVGIFGNVPPQ
jgi:hypothetical protein